MKKALALFIGLLAFLGTLPLFIQLMASAQFGADTVTNAIQGVTISVTIYSHANAIILAMLAGIFGGELFYWLVVK